MKKILLLVGLFFVLPTRPLRSFRYDGFKLVSCIALLGSGGLCGVADLPLKTMSRTLALSGCYALLGLGFAGLARRSHVDKYTEDVYSQAQTGIGCFALGGFWGSFAKSDPQRSVNRRFIQAAGIIIAAGFASSFVDECNQGDDY